MKWLTKLFDRSTDPVKHCDVYRDKAAGSCTHVDGPLCDFPKCSILRDYRASAVIDCEGTSPCSTCVNKRECGRSGCVRIAARRGNSDAGSTGTAGVPADSPAADPQRNEGAQG